MHLDYVSRCFLFVFVWSNVTCLLRMGIYTALDCWLRRTGSASCHMVAIHPLAIQSILQNSLQKEGERQVTTFRAASLKKRFTLSKMKRFKLLKRCDRKE